MVLNKLIIYINILEYFINSEWDVDQVIRIRLQVQTKDKRKILNLVFSFMIRIRKNIMF